MKIRIRYSAHERVARWRVIHDRAIGGSRRNECRGKQAKSFHTGLVDLKFQLPPGVHKRSIVLWTADVIVAGMGRRATTRSFCKARAPAWRFTQRASFKVP